jgi:uncharacterized iron-regulated membrane protein
MTRRMLLVLLVFGLVFVFLIYRLSYPKEYVEKAQPLQTQALEVIEEWKEFKPQSEGFTVSLPSTPQHAAEIVHAPDGEGQIRYDMFISQSRKNVTYMINIIEYPVGC